MKIFMFLLRLFPPEIAHTLALNILNFLYKIGLTKILFKVPKKEKHFYFNNLTFKNRVGVAAGLDKNGDYIDALGSLGFGFIEVGTVTPVQQFGNPKPRIFRFKHQHAIINRLGFNNKGVDYLVSRIQSRSFDGVLGVNIGANKSSEGQKRIDDYVECFLKVAPYADYIAINISSPNSPNLRTLHQKENLLPLLEAMDLARVQANYSNPVFIKLSPDESNDTIFKIVDAINKFQFHGVIVSNTTLEHDQLKDSQNENISGGLSGKPLFEKSNLLLKTIHSYDSSLIKIGVGGVFNKEDFQQKIESGASLVQIYTSFIYQGPRIINKLLN